MVSHNPQFQYACCGARGMLDTEDKVVSLASKCANRVTQKILFIFIINSSFPINHVVKGLRISGFSVSGKLFLPNRDERCTELRFKL